MSFCINFNKIKKNKVYRIQLYSIQNCNTIVIKISGSDTVMFVHRNIIPIQQILDSSDMNCILV